MAGRSVYDGGGITPDITVETEYYSRPMVALIYSNILSDFAIEYYKKHEKIAPAGEFSLTDEEFEEFVKFAADKEFDQRSESQIEMERVIEAAKREGLYEQNKEILDTLKDGVTHTKEEFIRHNKANIKEALEREICIKYYFQRGGAENNIRYNEQMEKAVELWDDSILVP